MSGPGPNEHGASPAGDGPAPDGKQAGAKEPDAEQPGADRTGAHPPGAGPASADAPVERLTAFIAGDAPSSRQAMHNLTGVLDSLGIPPERLAVVDVIADPGAALDAGALVTPSLQVVRSGRVRWFLGDLTDQRDLVAFLA